VPEPPDGLTAESRELWTVWFESSVAAHWWPHDVAGLRMAIRSFDRVQRAMQGRTASGRMIRESQAWLNAYGLAPKGRQLRHWLPPLMGVED
jgi:hypothetical protein